MKKLSTKLIFAVILITFCLITGFEVSAFAEETVITDDICPIENIQMDANQEAVTIEPAIAEENKNINPRLEDNQICEEVQEVQLEGNLQPVVNADAEPNEGSAASNSQCISNSGFNYSVTISDAKGNHIAVTGGSETTLLDILHGLGYSVDEESTIEVDSDSIDSNVISVSKSQNGALSLKDNGPFNRAAKNLIVYVNGEAIELELVDPNEISGNITAQQIQDAFSTGGGAVNVKLSDDVTITDDNSIELNGLHELYLNGKTLTGISGATKPMFIINDGAQLDVYSGEDASSQDDGKILGSYYLFKVNAGGVLNIYSGTTSTSHVSLIFNKGVSTIYGGTITEVDFQGDTDAIYINNDNEAFAKNLEDAVKADGKVILLRNVELDSSFKTVTIGHSTTLDLNGKVIKGYFDGDEGYTVLMVEADGQLTIKDSNPTAKHLYEADSNGLWTLNDNASESEAYEYEMLTTCPNENAIIIVKGGAITGGGGNFGGGINNLGPVVMEGGSIIGNNAVKKGGGVCAEGTSFTMKAGKIAGNTVNKVGGAGVALRERNEVKAVFEMEDGEITFNTSSKSGGGVDCTDGSFHMYGGKIYGNNAIDNGGGVNNGVSSSSFHMHGGTVTGNYAGEAGGGLYTASSDCSFDGECTLTGNTAGDDYNDDNVYLAYDQDTETNSIVIIGDGGSTKTYTGKGTLLAGSEIGVTIEGGSGFATAEASADYKQYFVSDNTKLGVHKSGKGSKIQVFIGNPVAQNTDTDALYATVQAAVDATDTNDTVNIKMIANSTENLKIGDGNTDVYKIVVLDLNGKVLKGDGTDSVIIVDYDGKLTIKDSNSSAVHKYVVDTNGLWVLNDSATGGKEVDTLTAIPVENDVIIVKGGAITGGKEFDGGGIHCEGILVMEAGNVVGNTASDGNQGEGGGVFGNPYSTITMKGGRIVGNYALYSGAGLSTRNTFDMENGSISFNTCAGKGGGVDCSQGTFHMYAGKITGNTAGSYGGGVDNESSSCSFHMHGGSVTGNHAVTCGGGLYTNKSDCSFDGKCIVTGNTSGADKHADNVYLDNSSTVFIGDAGSEKTYTGKGTLLTGTVIGATLQSETGNVTAAASTDYKKYFTSDVTTYSVYNSGKGDNQQVYIGKPVVINVDTEVIYEKIEDAISDADSSNPINLKLIANATENMKVGSVGDTNPWVINFDLNGKTLTAKSNAAVVSVLSGTLTLKDSGNGGKVTGGKGGMFGAGGGVVVLSKCTFNMEGGIITGNSPTGSGGGVHNSGTFNMKGGTITSNTTGNGGGVYNSTSATFNMTGGSITGNSATYNGGVANDGTMTVGGNARISGNTLSGDNSTSNLFLNTGKIVTIITGIDAPKSGMSIGIITADVPTSDTPVQVSGTNNADYSKYFFSDVSSYKITNINDVVFLRIRTAADDIADSANNSPIQLAGSADAYQIRIIVYTTDFGRKAVATISNKVASIVVEDGDKKLVDPFNVTIADPIALIEAGANTAEIRVREKFIVAINIASAMCGKNECHITLDNIYGVITLACDGKIIFSVDLTDIIDTTGKLVFDGKTLKAYDINGYIIDQIIVEHVNDELLAS